MFWSCKQSSFSTRPLDHPRRHSQLSFTNTHDKTSPLIHKHIQTWILTETPTCNTRRPLTSTSQLMAVTSPAIKRPRLFGLRLQFQDLHHISKQAKSCAPSSIGKAVHGSMSMRDHSLTGVCFISSDCACLALYRHHPSQDLLRTQLQAKSCS
jgi:hypothetical protein